MAQVLRTNDHSIWFTATNFQETPAEGVLAVLSALQGGQTIALLLNGTHTLWARFAGGSQQALRAADDQARQTWDAIAPGTWVTLLLAPGAAAVPTGPLPAVATGSAPPASPVPPPALPAMAVAPAAKGANAPVQRSRLFDAYLFIDWSSTSGRATAPGPDQLWLGELLTGSPPTEHWFPARADCARHVEDRLLHHVASRRRVLVGFDFAYGYPAGFVRAAGLPAPAGPWLAVWTALASLLEDDAQNRSNRFDVAAALNAMMTPPGAGVAPGPYWNTPAPGPMLTSTSPGFPYATRSGVILSAWRIAEERLRQTGLRPHSVFKLYTPGSVGSQVLTGIPVLRRLRTHPLLRDCSLVWPFETGFGETVAPGRRPFVLHAEVWPGVVQRESEQLQAADPQLIKDQAQVRALCLWADAQDATGALAPFFAPSNLSSEERERCVNEEGWILGTL